MLLLFFRGQPIHYPTDQNAFGPSPEVWLKSHSRFLPAGGGLICSHLGPETNTQPIPAIDGNDREGQVD